MIKRHVVTIITAFIFFFANPTSVDAKSSFWDYFFKTKILLQEVSISKDELFAYLNMVQLVKETQVLSATTANPINEEKILSEGSDTITTTPIDNLVPTIIEDEIADTSLNIKTSPIPTKTTIEATPKVSPTDHILNEINKFRESHGISRVTKENYSCDFANIRARELASSFTHDGFEQRKNNDLLPFPNWSNVTENIAMNSNYLRVIDQWTSSPGHAENILADTPHICVGKYENYFAMIGWKP